MQQIVNSFKSKNVDAIVDHAGFSLSAGEESGGDDIKDAGILKTRLKKLLASGFLDRFFNAREDVDMENHIFYTSCMAMMKMAPGNLLLYCRSEQLRVERWNCTRSVRWDNLINMKRIYIMLLLAICLLASCAPQDRGNVNVLVDSIQEPSAAGTDTTTAAESHETTGIDIGTSMFYTYVHNAYRYDSSVEKEGGFYKYLRRNNG